MAINVNELILDKVRSLIFTDLEDGSVIGRLTKLEDPSLQTAAEAEEVTDAQGALITKLFRAKTGRFEATNSLFSMDLLAQQYGTEKETASELKKILVPCEETLEIAGGKVTLSHEPAGDIKYIYKLENNALATKYSLATGEASTTEFTITGKEITTPTDVTGKIWVEYEYETTEGVKVANDADKFPTSVGVKIFALFRDPCNDGTTYAGTIVARKGKIDASSIDTSLTATGKHSFAIDFMKDYCSDEENLFNVILAK